MKSSTVLGIGLLAVLGVGAYIYLKNKKATKSSVTLPSTKNTSNTTGVKTSLSDDSLGLKPTPTNIAKTSVSDASLGLEPTPTSSVKTRPIFLGGQTNPAISMIMSKVKRR
jgi:hypothetical protein